MRMTEEEHKIVSLIAEKVKNMMWEDIRKHGINFQTASRMRKGEVPAMRSKTINRLKKALKIK